MTIEHKVTKAAQDAVDKNAEGVVWFVSDFGSRATNLHHRNSDRDVFCVYDQPPILHKKGENVEAFNESVDGIDIQGHSTVKFIEALASSDPMCVEALQSPIRYFQDHKIDGVICDIERAVERQMERIGLFYHYRSFAESNYKQYIANGNDPTYNRWSHVCRALLSAYHIHATGDLPPMDAFDLPDAVDDTVEEDSNWPNEEITKVFLHKATGNGDNVYHAPEELVSWTETRIETDIAHDKYDYSGIGGNTVAKRIHDVNNCLK